MALTQVDGGLLSPTNGQYTMFKNRIINGAMSIWQRGTSSSSAGYTTADRWKLSISGTVTFAQETTTIPNGSQYALKWTTGASSSYGQIRQFIETANLYDLRGQTVTASAMVQVGGTFTGNLQFEIGYATTSDSSSATYTLITGTSTGTVTSSGYTQITWTGTVPSNALGLYIGIVPTVVQASGAIAYMGNVQIEKGSTATSFDYRPYGTELALCQRYYYQITGGGTSSYAAIGSGNFGNTTQAQIVAPLPVTMRTSPTVNYSGTITADGGSGSSGNITSMGTVYGGSSATWFAVNTSGVTTGRGCVLYTANASTNYMTFSSEL